MSPKYLSRAKRRDAIAQGLQKELDKVTTVIAELSLEDSKSDLEDLKTELEEAKENMPENLQQSPRAEALEEAANQLEEAAQALEEAKDALDTLLNKVQEAIDAAYNADFPGMYG